MNTQTTSEQTAVAEAGSATEQNLFVTVPETTLPCVIVGGVVTRPAITVPAFQVGQYLCSQNPDGIATVLATGTPWVEIDYADARAACAAAGFALITELQALSLAFNLFQQNMNWTGGEVGVGDMFQGLRLDLDDTSEPYAFDFVSPDPSERRGFYLPGGQMVMDAAGNAYTWVFDDVQGDVDGLVSGSIAKNSPSLTCAPAPSREKGGGYVPSGPLSWSGRALLRGGCWYSGSHAGAFDLSRGWPGSGYSSVGFRCTKPMGL